MLTSRGLSSFGLWCVLFSAVACGEEAPIRMIALGSCAQQAKPQPIWAAVVAEKPDRFLFLGDNIYGDTTDMAELRRKYTQLGAQPGYQKLATACPILAIWDDHDYGQNDAGREFAQKAQSQQVFHDFFGLPADSPRRKRPGIYDSQIVGPEGRRVQFLLLDTRYFRSPLKPWTGAKRPITGPYAPDPSDEAAMLGAEQWQWLEAELRRPAELRIIASSVQVIAEEHGSETWGNFPRERARLFRLIRDTGAGGVVLVSGDRHLAELSRLAPSEDGPSYPLFDLTSSSLNQPSGGGNEREPNRHRVGEHYLAINFGTIAIDWEAADRPVRLAIHDGQGQRVREQTVPLRELSPLPAGK